MACKEWNQIPMSNQGFTGNSYDNTVDLGADAWRHVAFIEQRLPAGIQDGASLVEAAQRGEAIDGGVQTYQEGPGEGIRWLMASDVCKHCTHAACLEVCPTGALFRTEFGTVVVQEDVCNGCGYCVPACPFGVIDQREDDGRVWKCTLCSTASRTTWSPRARTPALRTQSSSGICRSSANTPTPGSRACTTPASATLSCIWPMKTTESAGAGASSCCSTTRGLRPSPGPGRSVRRLGEIWTAAAAAAVGLGAGLAAAVFGGRR